MVENTRNGMPGSYKQTPPPPTRSNGLPSMLELQKYIQDHIIVLQLTGKLNSHTSTVFQRELEQIAQDQTCAIILNMAALQQIDSAGIGILVSIFKQLQAHSQSLQIVGLQGQPYDIFKLLNLHKVIKITPTVDEALRNIA